jgi:hypothetical protein
MKRSLLLLFALLLCCAFPLLSQIPNGSFENWTNGSPDNWITTNSPPIFSNITKSSSAHAGTAAARGDVLTIAGTSVVLPPLLQAGVRGNGFSYNQRPAAANGWYQFFPAAGSGDQLVIFIALFKGLAAGQPIGAASASITATSSTYTQFSSPFFYFTSDTPDTCIIQFQIAGTAGQPHAGSYFILDDLSFGALSTSVKDIAAVPTSFGLDQNYPNPFNPSTAISYQLTAVSFVNLKVFDMLGREVESLVDGRKEAGRYSLNWNAANLPSGVYLYQLTAISEKGEMFKDTKRAILLK